MYVVFVHFALCTQFAKYDILIHIRVRRYSVTENKKKLSTKAQYDIAYAKQKLKRVPLDMQLEEYNKLKAAAERTGEKVNTYIKKAIAERMEREK